jgi:hypothetical protein
MRSHAAVSKLHTQYVKPKTFVHDWCAERQLIGQLRGVLRFPAQLNQKWQNARNQIKSAQFTSSQG